MYILCIYISYLEAEISTLPAENVEPGQRNQDLASRNLYPTSRKSRIRIEKLSVSWSLHFNTFVLQYNLINN